MPAKAWKEWKREIPRGVGALEENETRKVGVGFLHRQPGTGKLFAFGLGDASDDGDDSGDDDGGDDEGPGTITGGYPDSGDDSATGAVVGGQPAGTTYTPTPTSTPTSPSSPSSPSTPTAIVTAPATSHTTMYILGGVALLGAVAIGWAVFSKPKAKELRHESKRAGEMSRMHAKRARSLKVAAKKRAREEAYESRAHKHHTMRLAA